MFNTNEIKPNLRKKKLKKYKVVELYFVVEFSYLFELIVYCIYIKLYIVVEFSYLFEMFKMVMVV